MRNKIKFICVQSAYIPEKRRIKPLHYKGFVDSELKVGRGLDKHREDGNR